MKKMNVRGAVILLLTVTILGGCSGKTAGNYYKEGIKYAKNGYYEEAANDFAQAVQKKPDKAEYYIDYAMSLIMLGRNEEALANFDKVILDKNNLIVKENNKKAYRGKGIAYYNTHQYAEAIEFFDKALTINELTELNMDILYYKGSAEERSGKYEAAANTYSSIINGNSSDAETYNHRAFVYRKTGNYDMSRKDYDKAISLNNDNYDYYFGKYFLLMESGDKSGAGDVLKEAADIKVETEEDKFNLAKVHYYMGDDNGAIKELNEAFSNGFTEAYYYLGQIYEAKEDYESAINNYELYIKDETISKSANVYNQIGNCFIKLGKYEEALSYIQAGLELNDISLEQPLKRNEIVSYEKLGNYKDAYGLMKDYIKLYPKDKEAATEFEFIKTRLPEVSPAK